MSSRKKQRKRSILSRICCPWTSSKKKVRLQAQSSNTNEPSEYVLEKLAIKSMPLSSFGPSKHLLRRFDNIPCITDSPSMSPSTSISSNPREQISSPLPSRIACISSHNAMIKHDENPFHLQYTPKTVTVQDKEAQMVSNILNKHASLYTLDDKNAVPKDPMNPPRNTVVVPSSVQEAYAKEKSNLIQAKARTLTSSSKRSTSYKKEMTPEIKETINALRLAQKPHFPGVQPKNQKSITPSITPVLRETEISSRLLGLKKERYFSELTNYFLVDIASENYDSSLKIIEKLPVVPNNKFEQKVPKIVEHNEEETLLTNIFLQSKPSSKSSEIDLIQPNKKNEFLVEEDKPKIVKSVSLESLEEFPQKSESTAINQLKCQNLKWKIIIKHHSDKPKQQSETNKNLDTKELLYNTRHCLLDNNLKFPG
ncbi:hypothetical protein FQR65_LT01227 [Abscondita terminalis]|nr:hypothetical protein FQR65_LT01227 [Abscondita terminalis]